MACKKTTKRPLIIKLAAASGETGTALSDEKRGTVTFEVTFRLPYKEIQFYLMKNNITKKDLFNLIKNRI